MLYTHSARKIVIVGSSFLFLAFCTTLRLLIGTVTVADPGWGIWGKCPPPFKKLHTRSIYSNRAVNYSNKAVTMFMRQCSLPMKLQIGFYFT